MSMWIPVFYSNINRSHACTSWVFLWLDFNNFASSFETRLCCMLVYELVLEQEGEYFLNIWDSKWVRPCVCRGHSGSQPPACLATSLKCKHFFSCRHLSPLPCRCVNTRGGIWKSDTPRHLTARHVFKRLLNDYHRQPEAAFVFASSGMQPLVRVLIELTLASAVTPDHHHLFIATRSLFEHIVIQVALKTQLLSLCVRTLAQKLLISYFD